MENDNEERFSVSKPSFNGMILDMLIEISARQQAYHQFYLKQLSKQSDIDLDYLLKNLDKEIDKARESVINALNAEYGGVPQEKL